eukprot:8998997-Alexandrium_andersonii.AAC.1
MRDVVPAVQGRDGRAPRLQQGDGRAGQGWRRPPADGRQGHHQEGEGRRLPDLVGRHRHAE